MADCNLNEKKIGILCVPYCYSELTTDQVHEITSHANYCFLDYINRGFSINDL